MGSYCDLHGNMWQYFHRRNWEWSPFPWPCTQRWKYAIAWWPGSFPEEGRRNLVKIHLEGRFFGSRCQSEGEGVKMLLPSSVHVLCFGSQYVRRKCLISGHLEVFFWHKIICCCWFVSSVKGKKKITFDFLAIVFFPFHSWLWSRGPCHFCVRQGYVLLCKGHHFPACNWGDHSSKIIWVRRYLCIARLL